MPTLRLQYIDIAKGIAICLVVIGHVLYFSLKPVDGISTLVFPVLGEIISSFHMPFFIFLSGLVANYTSTEKKYVCKIYKKVRQLVFPYLIFGSLVTLFSGCTIYSLFNTDGKNGYWYLLVLFELYMLKYIKEILASKEKNKWYYDVAFYVIVTLILKILYIFCTNKLGMFFCLYRVQLYYPFFWGAIMVNKYKLHRLIFNKIMGVVLFFVYIALFVLRYNGLSFVGEGYIIPSCAIVPIIWLCRSLENTSCTLVKTLKLCGQNSLYIYVFHYFILFLIHFDAQTDISNFIICIFLTTISIVTSLLLSATMHQIPRLSKLIFYRQ